MDNIVCRICKISKDINLFNKNGKILKSCDTCRNKNKNIQEDDRKIKVLESLVSTLRKKVNLLEETNIDYETIIEELSIENIQKENGLKTFDSLPISRCVKDSICVICNYTLRRGDKIIELSCGHKFDIHCIMRLLINGNDKCPLCRKSVIS